MKEFFARLNPIERRFVVAVAVLFFLVINIVWIVPRFSDWGKTKDRMATASSLKVKFQQGIDRIPDLQRAIRQYTREGPPVPAADQAVYFLRTIQNQAAQSGVGIINIGSTRQASGTNNPYFLEQNQTITTASGEKQLVDFLYNLGASNSLIRVKVLSVQPDAQHQQLSARITLVASYQKKPGTAGPAAPSAPAGTGPAAAPKPAPATIPPKPATPPPPITKPATSGPVQRTTSPGPAGAVPKLRTTNSMPPSLPGGPKPLLPNKK
jgi:hypothetical protein